MSINDISALTYSQTFTLMACLRESNKAAKSEHGKMEAFMRLQGAYRG